MADILQRKTVYILLKPERLLPWKQQRPLGFRLRPQVVPALWKIFYIHSYHSVKFLLENLDCGLLNCTNIWSCSRSISVEELCSYHGLIRPTSAFFHLSTTDGSTGYEWTQSHLQVFIGISCSYRAHTKQAFTILQNTIICSRMRWNSRRMSHVYSR
jgi:hypothetical protein